MKQICRVFAILFIAVGLNSCLDCEEEVWINADASGAGSITITVPAAATSLHGGEAGVKALAEDFLKSSSAFDSYLVGTSTANRRTTIHATFTFSDVRDFLDDSLTENLDHLPSGGREFAGVTEVKFEGLNIAFSRRRELSKAIPGAMFIPQSRLAGHEIKTIIHLPKAATSHNATSAEDAGRTLIWTTPLASAIRAPIETNFKMPLPIPWATVSVIALVILLLFVGLIYYVIRSRKKRTLIL